jgi:hypothetical protein
MAAVEAAGRVEVPTARKVPLLHIIILVLATWIIFVWAYVTRVGAGSKYWTVTGAWLPWIYLIMIAAFIGKKTGKIIDKTLLIAIMFALCIVTAKWYYFSGTSEVDFINNLAGTLSASLSIGVWPPEASQYIKNLIPSWMVVWDPIAADRYYRGGGEPIWGSMAPPIITWTIIFIALALQGMFLTFALLGPEFWEVQRLPFAITVPTRFVINNVYTEDPKTFGDIFFNVRKYRIFWVGVVVGLLLNLPYLVSQILPAVPWGAYIGGGYGVLGIDQLYPGIYDAVHSIFPNAIWIGCTIALTNILIFMLVPYQISTTILVWVLGFGWLYPGIATRMGLIPAGASPYWYGPIPMGTLSGNHPALYLGLALIVFYAMRRRIADFIRLVRVNGSIEGVSARVMLGLFLIGILLFLGIWSAAGLDPFTNFLVWLLFILTAIGGAYFYAALFWYGAHCTGYDLWWLVYPVSSSLGLLPTVPTAGHSAAAVFGYYVATMGTCVGAFEGNCMYNPTILVSTYSLGAGTRADLKRLFVYMLVVLIALPPFAFFFDAWFNSHVGIVYTSQSGMDMHWWNPASAAMDLGVRSITWSAPPIPIHIAALWSIGWAIFIFLSYLISARIPILGYFLHPIGIVAINTESWWSGWVNPLIGVMIKYLLTRTVGAKRAYDITVELVSGLAVGFGLLYLVLGAYVFFGISLPTLAALWK